MFIFYDLVCASLSNYLKEEKKLSFLPVTKLDTISGRTSICSILMSSSPGNEKYLTSR